MRQDDRRINWSADTTATILQKISAADGFPGVRDAMFDVPCRLFDAHSVTAQIVASFSQGEPGAVLARRGPALLRRTVDGAI